MDTILLFSLFLALIWGILYAVFLQKFELGKFIVDELTWLSVVIGSGVVIGLGKLCIPLSYWWQIVALFALSGIPIVVRSLVNHRERQQSLVKSYQDRERTIVNKRIANNVLNGLEDIVACCLFAREAFERGRVGTRSLSERERGVVWIALTEMLVSITTIERKAMAARNGEYVE